MLDLVGYPPSLEQVKAFMAEPNVDKRSEKIDQLLDSEEWADRTARLFCEGWFGDYHKVPIMISPKLDGGAEQRIANDFVAWMKLKLSKPSPKKLELAEKLIESATEDRFDFDQYEDAYERRIKELPVTHLPRDLSAVSRLCLRQLDRLSITGSNREL